MRIFLRILKYLFLGILSVISFIYILWWIGILVYAPLSPIFTASVWVLLVILILVSIFFRRWRAMCFCLFTVLSLIVALAFFFIKSTNNRDWIPEYQRLPFVESSDDDTCFTIYNMRDFLFRTSNDYDIKYIDKTFKKDDFIALYYIIVYFDNPLGDAIGHTMLGYQFGKEFFFLSVETRRDATSQFGAIPDLYKQDGLIYVVGTASDLLGVRTNARVPEEHVYMFKTSADKECALNWLSFYAMHINTLRYHPQFYNTVLNSCLISLLPVMSSQLSLPIWHRSYLLNGYSPELGYDMDWLEREYPNESFESLKKRSYINARMHSWDHKRETYLPLMLKEKKE